MGRFMYKHFGDDIPRHIEKEYNRMLRYEQYQYEKDAENGLIDVEDFDGMLNGIADSSTLLVSEMEEENKLLHEKRLRFLPVAMEMLKIDYPEEYALIRDYYYSEEKITICYLMEKYRMSRPVLKRRLRRARNLLKRFIIMHEKDD